MTGKGLKILAAADIHGDKKLVAELAKRAEKENVDLVVLCGDLTFFEADLSGLIGPFKKRGKKVLLVPGNHETIATANFLAQMYPETYNIHGYSIVFDDIGFFGIGSGNIGLFEIGDRDVKKILKKAAEGIKDLKRKILITHVPPYGTNLDDLGWTKAGSKSIREIIEEVQPEYCLCGHIHETFGKSDMIGKTKVINVGRKGRIIRLPKGNV